MKPFLIFVVFGDVMEPRTVMISLTRGMSVSPVAARDISVLTRDLAYLLIAYVMEFKIVHMIKVSCI